VSKADTQLACFGLFLLPVIPVIWLVVKVANLFGYFDRPDDGMLLSFFIGAPFGAVVWLFIIYEVIKHV
jgi:hypothetical protein